jgi:magnesium and cobalt transporter
MSNKSEPGPRTLPKKHKKRSLLKSVKDAFKKKFAKRVSSFEESVSELIREHDHDASVHKEERQILSNIVQFGDKLAEDIMIPRTDITAAASDISLNNLKELFLAENHARIPIYKNSIDEILGFVHIKDLFKVVTSKRKFNMKEILREILFVPSSIKITDLLSKMKQSKFHMAIILDEYGGTDGLVTIEDILEEIVGEINDEYDESAPEEHIKKDGENYLIEAKALVEAVEKLIGIFAEKDPDYDTFGGFIITKLGRIPAVGEILEIIPNYQIEVLAADNRRLILLKLMPSK